MRFLFLNQFFWPDTAATGQLLNDLATAVAHEGHTVSVICGQSGYGAIDERSRPPVTILRCGAKSFSRGKLARVFSYASFIVPAAWRVLMTPKADVVVTMTTPPLLSLLGAMAQIIRGSRHFVWEMDVYPDIAEELGVIRKGSFASRIIGGLADWARRRADGVIVLGEDMKARLIARGVSYERIHVAENWANGAEITPGPLPEGPLVVYYSGNLGLAHDVQTVADAMDDLKSSAVRFVFAGGGPRRALLEQRCAGFSNVEFRAYSGRGDLGASLAAGHLGLVTQLPNTLGAVVPSKTYGILAAGRPLLYVGPSGTAPADIIEKYGCGWRIEPGDHRALVSLIEYLQSNRALIARAGRRARQVFEEHYDVPIGVSRILAVFGISDAAPGPDLVPRGAQGRPARA